MSSTNSVPALLLLFSFALVPPVVPRRTVELPQAVLAHPAAESAPSPPVVTPRWFPQALATWGGPRPPPPREGLYDERYITW